MMKESHIPYIIGQLNKLNLRMNVTNWYYKTEEETEEHSEAEEEKAEEEEKELNTSGSKSLGCGKHSLLVIDLDASREPFMFEQMPLFTDRTDVETPIETKNITSGTFIARLGATLDLDSKEKKIELFAMLNTYLFNRVIELFKNSQLIRMVHVPSFNESSLKNNSAYTTVMNKAKKPEQKCTDIFAANELDFGGASKTWDEFNKFLTYKQKATEIGTRCTKKTSLLKKIYKGRNMKEEVDRVTMFFLGSSIRAEIQKDIDELEALDKEYSFEYGLTIPQERDYLTSKYPEKNIIRSTKLLLIGEDPLLNSMQQPSKENETIYNGYSSLDKQRTDNYTQKLLTIAHQDLRGHGKEGRLQRILERRSLKELRKESEEKDGEPTLKRKKGSDKEKSQKKKSQKKKKGKKNKSDKDEEEEIEEISSSSEKDKDTPSSEDVEQLFEVTDDEEILD